MAYFLDAELNALATGARKAPGSSNGSPSRRTPNRYPKPCHTCKTYVQAKAGYLAKEAGAWVVYCTNCP